MAWVNSRRGGPKKEEEEEDDKEEEALEVLGWFSSGWATEHITGRHGKKPRHICIGRAARTYIRQAAVSRGPSSCSFCGGSLWMVGVAHPSIHFICPKKEP